MEILKPISSIFLLKKPYLGNSNGIVIDCLEDVNELSYLNQIRVCEVSLINLAGLLLVCGSSLGSLCVIETF